MPLAMSNCGSFLHCVLTASRESKARTAKRGGRREKMVSQTNSIKARGRNWILGGLALSVMTVLAVLPAFSARGPKAETIEASAMGTGSQMGQVIGVAIEIYEYSTPEDKQILGEAFAKGQNQGLVNALTKMR